MTMADVDLRVSLQQLTHSTLSNFNGLFHSLFLIKLKRSVGVKGLTSLVSARRCVIPRSVRDRHVKLQQIHSIIILLFSHNVKLLSIFLFQYFIELGRIKKCFTQTGGIFVLEEFGKVQVCTFCFSLHFNISYIILSLPALTFDLLTVSPLTLLLTLTFALLL